MDINMKKTTYQARFKRGVLLTLSAFLMFSCSDDFFDQPAGGKILPDQHYNSFEDVIYSSYMGVFSLAQQASINLVVVDGLFSDLMEVTGNASQDMIDLNSHNVTPENFFNDPSVFYKIIINANEVLANTDIVITRDIDYDSLVNWAVKGELVALRSWAYFNLARLYGKVMYLGSSGAASLPGELPVVGREAIIDTLINQVEAYLTEITYATGTYFINKEALLAELYLEKNDYSHAASYAKLAIETLDDYTYNPSAGRSSRYYRVDRTFEKAKWKNIFVNAANNPQTVMTGVPFSLSNNQINMLEEYFKFQYMIRPTRFITDLFNNQNYLKGAGDINRGLGISFVMLDENTPMINKYSLETSSYLDAHNILYRAEDIHMVMAEALNRMNDTTALIFINNGIKNVKGSLPGFATWRDNLGIRGRVELLPVTVPESITDETARMEYIEELIIQERSMELAFEGKRWFDLMRVARRRNDPSWLASKVAAKFSNPAEAEAIRTKLLTEENWYMPSDN
jgi:hypothetical protein